MRIILFTYCLLTMLFTGACAVALGKSGEWSDLLLTGPGRIVTLATVANAAFIWMALKEWPGRPLIVTGIVYSLVQCALVWWTGVWSLLGGVVILVFAAIAIKCAMVVFTGLAADREG
jgi:hypothetical protein